jgi:fucose 4-O-acetylase-like acetyltransferase
MAQLGDAGETQAAEPPGRDRYVDFLRVLAIGMVVVGHWLVTSVIYHSGSFQAADVLGIIRWGQWVTLLFQVMPVFFFVGGYAAALSWSARRARGVSAANWLRGRTVRLLVPTAAYAAVALVGAEVCILLKAPPATLALAGWAIALQLWFLPVYLALTALTPALYAAHQRWGLVVPAVMAAVGIAIDFVVIYARITPLGWLNYVLIWGAVYQMGFAWQDGTLTRNRRILPALVVGGAALFAGLVLLGPFPPSLIGVTGERVNNTAPPSAALAAYAAAQIGLLVAVAPAMRRWLRHPRLWRAVSRSNKIVMTVYLWHMVPVLVAGTVLYLTGVMPQPGVGSAEWWELRPVWVAVLAVLLAGLLVLLNLLVRSLGRAREKPTIESGGTVAGTAVAQPLGSVFTVVLWVGVVLAGYALYRFAVSGFAPNGEFPIVPTLSYAAGLALVLLSGIRSRAERQ